MSCRARVKDIWVITIFNELLVAVLINSVEDNLARGEDCELK